MSRNLNRRIHPIAEADGLSPKKRRKRSDAVFRAIYWTYLHLYVYILHIIR